MQKDTNENIYATIAAALMDQSKRDKEEILAKIAELQHGSVKKKEEIRTGFLEFTDKELSKMPKEIKKEFRTNGLRAHIRKRIRGNSVNYEIRIRRQGYNISASGVTVEDAKKNFIVKLSNCAKQNISAPIIPKGFNEFSLYWFENFHKRKVVESTYTHDIKLYHRHIKDELGKYSLTQINAVMLQTFLDGFNNRSKTKDDVYSIINQIMNCAVKHGLLSINPLGMCFHSQHKRKNGKAIPKEKEKQLLRAFVGQPYQLHFAVILYTGLRPNEYPTAQIKGDFIKAVNSKRHGANGEIFYKMIPITPMLKPYLEGIKQISLPQAYILEDRFKKVLPDHKLYDMRTTFQTRCSECGIPDNVIGIVMGNSIGKEKEAYTDFEDEDFRKYLYHEMQRLNY